jgi:type III secretion system YscQ/HrcQ family protein
MTGTDRPLVLPQVSPAAARSLNTLIGTSRALPFTWGGQPAQLRFTAPAEASPPTGYLAAALGSQAFTLGYVGLPEPASLGVEFAGLEASGLPPDLRLAVLEALAAEPLALLRGAGIALTLQGWRDGADLPAPALGWEIVRDGGRFLAGTVHLDDAALASIAGLLARVSPRPVHSADATPVSFGVAAAHMTLPLGQLAGLEPGDVLVPGLSRGDWEAGRCTLWAGSVRIGDAVRKQATVQILAMKPSPVPPPAPAAAPQLKVDDLPVQLQFDLAQLDITVGQLRTIAPGYSFELPAVPGRLVTIRANAREVGTGELVDLGENLGVRIVSWSLT